MGIIIRAKESGKVFDVPAGFVLQAENTSPVFNDLGSKTISASLPVTDNNALLMGFAHRSDVAYNPAVQVPVIVEYKSYIRDGVLYMSSAYNSDKTFGIVIAFSEGIMYESMNNVMLTALNGLPVIGFGGIDTAGEYLNRLLREDDGDRELSVFEVVLKSQEYTYEHEGQEYKETHSARLNPVYRSGEAPAIIFDSVTNIVVDGKLQEISVPVLFGGTPFIKVWRVLELIFAHFGYKVGSNPFKEHYQLKRLCVLNNTIDAVVGLQIDYSQLLPEVSIMEFLKALYCRFGIKVFFDPSRNEVNIYLLKHILTQANAVALGDHTPLDLEYTSPKQLKLSAARNLDRSSTETETYEEFLAKYNNTVDFLFSGKGFSGGVSYLLDEGLFRRAIAGEGSTINKIISSIHFDWNKKDEGFETEEITSIDECLTMLGDKDCPFFGLDGRLLNSTLTINGDFNTELFAGESKLAFAYDMGEMYYLNSGGTKNYQGHNWGSIFPILPDANKYYEDKQGNIYNYALTFVGEDGAFNRFFKEYDAVLRHSNRTAKTTLRTPLYDAAALRFDQKFHSNYQPLLLDKANYNLGVETSGNLIEIEVEARTLRLYKPYDLDKEQALPVPGPILYKWKQTDDKDASVEEERAMREAEVKDEFKNVTGYRFISFTVKSIEDKTPPGGTFWFLPPTQDQFNNQSTIGHTRHPITITFIHSFYMDFTEGYNSKIRNINYNAWFVAEEI